MKKKIIIMVLTLVFTLLQTVCVFGSGSITASAVIADGSGRSDSLLSSISAGNDMVYIEIGQQAVASDASVVVQVNDRGEAVVGDTVLSFVQGSEHAIVGLSEDVISSINGINSGFPLKDIISDVNLNGYNALIGTHAIMIKDVDTGVEKTEDVQFPLYVPNLIDGLGDVEILFFNNSIGKWVIITPNQIDTASKTVWLTIPGSGTFSVIYKR